MHVHVFEHKKNPLSVDKDFGEKKDVINMIMDYDRERDSQSERESERER